MDSNIKSLADEDKVQTAYAVTRLLIGDNWVKTQDVNPTSIKSGTSSVVSCPPAQPVNSICSEQAPSQSVMNSYWEGFNAALQQVSIKYPHIFGIGQEGEYKKPANQVTRLTYSVTEVAQMLNVSKKTVYRLVDRGQLKATKALRHLRITATSLNDFIKKTST